MIETEVIVPMYVTLEPMPDVFRCDRTVPDDTGSSRMYQLKGGLLCRLYLKSFLDIPEFNHQVELTTGVMEEECSQMMKSFLKN